MATTFLQLANRVIRRIGEVELTTTTGQRGISAFVLDAVNDSIRQINAKENEWPFNYSAQTTDLVSGQSSYALGTTVATVDWESFFLRPVELVTNGTFASDILSWTDLSTGTGAISYVSTGNGRMNLNGGASGIASATQVITTATNIQYRLQVKTYGGTITLKIGTTSGGSEISTQTLTMTNLNRGMFYEFFFIATGVATYITFTNSANASYQIDLIQVRENFEAVKLRFVTFDYYNSYLKARDFNLSPSAYERPAYVTRLQNGSFAISTIPKLEYRVEYDAFIYPVALSASSDTILIPDKYSDVIVDGALYQCYMYKEDFEQAGIAKAGFKDGIQQMRTQLINNSNSMEGTRYGSGSSNRDTGW